MKVCPQCDRVFEDETLRFCLMDGQPLVEGSGLPTVAISSGPTQEQTVVMPTETVTRQAAATRKRRSKVPWIIAASLLMLVLIGVSGWLLAEMARKGRLSSANRNAVNVAAARNARLAVTPGSTRTPEPASASPEPVDEISDDVTPISWTTAASTFKTDAGRIYHFECPSGGASRVIWGSDVYTTDSSICTAAVHAGVITLEGGGEVIVEMRPGRALYGSTERNGIESNPSDEYPSSFVVRKAVPDKKN